MAAGVFAIHEPRQYETVTAFLVVGTERAVLFDYGPRRRLDSSASSAS